MPCVSLKHRRLYRDLIKSKSSSLVKPINPPEIPNSATSVPKNAPKSNHNQLTTLLTDGMTVQIHQSRYLVSTAAHSAAVQQELENLQSATPTSFPIFIKAPLRRLKKLVSRRTKKPQKSKKPAKTTKTSYESKNPATSAKTLQKSQKPRKLTKVPKLTKASKTAKTTPQKPTRADLINAESRLGSTIFGPIPAGRRREFFHDHDNIWIWHESWTDAKYRLHQTTIRYEIRPDGIYKKVSAGRYIRLTSAEVANFRHAARTYLKLIKQYLYRRSP